MGTLYYLVPRMFGRTKMYSVPAIELHFWIATFGIVLYIAAMWIAGVMQGLMWRAVNADGTLIYTFVESVKATYPVLRDPPARRRCSTSRGMLMMALERRDDDGSHGHAGATPPCRRVARRCQQPERQHEATTHPGHRASRTRRSRPTTS